MGTAKSRLWMAMGCYAVFGALAAITMSGKMLLATLLFLLALAVKTWLATLR